MARTKAERLIERFPVTDLALAVTYRGSRRERFIQRFISEFTTKSWRAVRDCSPLIYNAQPPMAGLALPPPSWASIESKIARSAGKHNSADNIKVARLLRDLLSTRNFDAYEMPEQYIHLAPDRVVKIGINYYLVDNDDLVIQYFQPRADARVDGHVSRTLMSLVHYAYAFGDFEDAKIEMADLSAPAPGEDRLPRFHRLTETDLMSRDELNREIDNVHFILEKMSRTL